MLIQQKLGNINSSSINKDIDWLDLEWYETDKRILHKKTRSGKEITMKFLKANQNLTQGDILFEEAESIVAIDVQRCETIVIKPETMLEMASVCYEIGNKHIPLFCHEDELLIAYETPLFNLFSSLGYAIKRENRKLLNPLKTSVASHPHNSFESLFSKIMKLST